MRVKIFLHELLHQQTFFNDFFILKYNEPRHKKECPFFSSFLNHLLLIVFIQNMHSKLAELLQSKLEKNSPHAFVRQFVRNLCHKFKIDRFSRSCTGAR